jgi:hypothetical protein
LVSHLRRQSEDKSPIMDHVSSQLDCRRLIQASSRRPATSCGSPHSYPYKAVRGSPFPPKAGMPRYIGGELSRIRKIRPPVKRLVRLRLRRGALRQPSYLYFPYAQLVNRRLSIQDYAANPGPRRSRAVAWSFWSAPRRAASSPFHKALVACGRRHGGHGRLPRDGHVRFAFWRSGPS